MNAEHGDREKRDERLLDLLADRSVFGLEAAEERELAGLLRGRAGGDPEEFERLAAATAVAAHAPAADMPATLRARLHDDARQFAAGRRPAVSRSARQWFLPGGRAGLLLAGTVAAAACVLIMVGRPVQEPEPEAASRPETEIAKLPALPAAPEPVVQAPRQPTPALQRDEMLATVRDAQTIDCVAADADDEERASAGDVVWSDQRRRGFLRVRGLARSEPGRSQYRIWILDGSRGKPISGGVFDVAGDTAEVIVPILPQSPVQGPTMFVVTAEEPGVEAGYSLDRARVVARAD